MKTVMQELIDELEYMFKDDVLVFGIVQRAKYLLEKEKEQIMMAFNDGKINSVLKKRDSEEYYNQTYNHLHIVTDGNVGLSNPSETTNNKITISETKRSIEGIGLNNQNK
jgi:hypothetical protein